MIYLICYDVDWDSIVDAGPIRVSRAQAIQLMAVARLAARAKDPHFDSGTEWSPDGSIMVHWITDGRRSMLLGRTPLGTLFVDGDGLHIDTGKAPSLS